MNTRYCKPTFLSLPSTLSLSPLPLSLPSLPLPLPSLPISLPPSFSPSLFLSLSPLPPSSSPSPPLPLPFPPSSSPSLTQLHMIASQEHIDTAISLNPSGPNLFYLRGRWEYEVAALSWLEKKAAAALYATPPDATFNEALEDFMRVESLNGGGVWKANLMMVAKVSRHGASGCKIGWF